MARLTDTLRGASIALRAACDKLDQGDLFDSVDRELWESIRDRARMTISEEYGCVSALQSLRWLVL